MNMNIAVHNKKKYQALWSKVFNKIMVKVFVFLGE